MPIEIFRRGGVTDINYQAYPREMNEHQYLLGLDEHDLRDLEFALARLRAMSRHCTARDGRHACALAPEHDSKALHACRGCTHAWRPEEAVSVPET